jgi:polyhydroxyalkanoate synthesis regulator phasin
MNFKLRSLVAATIAGSMMMGFGVNAMADSTTDIVNALVAKGVLTEEEGALLTKGRTDEAAGQAKALKKASKLKVSDAIDNATVYGDVRVRYENRQGTGVGGSTSPVADSKEERQRNRYKVTLGVKTESGPWYSDLALAMGANGRSDNATFGKSATSNINDKETIFIKRAMVGYKPTEWLTLEAGRMNNPLYTTPMVWDADLSWESLAESFKYKAGDVDLFFTAAQGQYQGDKKDYTGTGTDSIVTGIYAFQGGAKFPITEAASAKAALTYTKYGHNTSTTTFKPGLGADGLGVTGVAYVAPTVGNGTTTANTLGTAYVQGRTGYGLAASGVNNLETIEIPAEVNFMAASNLGIRLFGDYAYNTKGDERAIASGLTAAANGSSGSDDAAWMLGVAIGSAKDLKAFEGNKMAKGDWAVRVWYQDVGVWSVDANAVDSDFMDSRVNMKGTTVKAQYNIQDNLYANFAYGHATRKNETYGSAGAARDLDLNLNKFDLVQLDLTYKF